MLCGSSKAAERDRLLTNCKVKLKKWEEEFIHQYKRKPEKEDMRSAPLDVKECYRQYWKLCKHSQKDSIRKKDYDVFGSAFNKSSPSIATSNRKIASNLLSYSLKLQDYAKKQTTALIRNVDQCSSGNTEDKSELNQGKVSREDTTAETVPENESEKNEDSLMDLVERPQKNKENNILKINDLFCVHLSQRKKARFTRPINVGAKSNARDLLYKSNIQIDWLERCLLNSFLDKVNNSSVLSVISNSPNDAMPEKESCFSNLMDKETNEDLFSVFDEAKEHSSNEMEPCKTSVLGDHLVDCSVKILKEQDLDNVGGTTSLSVENNTESTSLCFPSDMFLQSSQKGSFSYVKNKHSSDNDLNVSSTTKDATVTPVTTNKKPIVEDSANLLSDTHLIQDKKFAHLKSKMQRGTINENYVKINIKKKKFVRGHKYVTPQQYKRQKWKEIQKQKEENRSTNYKSSSCFHCGRQGHWARNCPDEAEKGTMLEEDWDQPLPTLEEAAAMAKNSQLSGSVCRIMPKEVTEESVVHVTACNLVPSEHTENAEGPVIEISPIFNHLDNGETIETAFCVHEALDELGYSSFRPGQEKAIMRILSGLSTLVISATGSGKSLCYQLPAYIYAKHFKCITLVISPLLSLMEDQASGQLHKFKAVCLHSGMTPVQRQQSCEAVESGKAHVLLVSPEAVIGYGSRNSLLPKDLPPVAFACIDEAHCLSEWSHNFRPSYLQLRKVLMDKLKIKCILALTATATKSTALDIANHLHFTNIENAIIGQTTIPENLVLSISRERYRDEAIIDLLKSDTYSKCKSVIVYCTRREDTERLATLIRTCLQDIQVPEVMQLKQTNRKRQSSHRNLAWDAAAYHAGLTAARRKSVQARFMSGQLRVVVATVAFGMGLDKSDVHGIIHYNMPKSFESYVQEIGRAGRDGLLSNCHLFLDPEAKDIYELRRHVYANSIDRHIIRRFLGKIFNCCKCQKQEDNLSSSQAKDGTESKEEITCPGHEVALPIDSVVQDLNVKEENLLTLLCYLELYYKGVLEIHQPSYATCTIQCYRGYNQLVTIARKCPPVAVAMALNQEKNNSEKKTNKLTFSVMEVAGKTGWNSALIKKALKDLEWGVQGHQNRKTGIVVEFSSLAFHVTTKCNLSEEKQDEMLEFLHKRVVAQEQFELRKLQMVYDLFESMSSPFLDFNVDKSNNLKLSLQEYFMGDYKAMDDDGISTHINDTVNLTEQGKDKLEEVRNTIKKLICTHHDQSFTGRTIAKILYGIGSPCFPAEVWGRARNFWRAHLDVGFNQLISIANEEILKLR